LLVFPLAVAATNEMRFADVPVGAWYADYVSDAARAGIVNGYSYPDGTLTGLYGPGNSVTIAEALKMAVAGRRLDTDVSVTGRYAGHWAERYAEVAMQKNFGIALELSMLDRAATRAEVARIVASAFEFHHDTLRALDDYTDVPLGHTHAQAIEALTLEDVMVGDNRSLHCGPSVDCVKTKFRPDDVINRAEVAKIIMAARYAWLLGNDPPPAASSASAAACGEKQYLGEAGLIRYTDSGFCPPLQEEAVTASMTFVFRNDSAQKMWVASDPHPAHTDVSAFDAGQGIAPGGTYQFTFAAKGTYRFHNHLRSTHTATIILR
jgi:S-layer homology domain